MTDITYWLPTTALRLRGTRTEVRPASPPPGTSAATAVHWQSDVTLAVRADARAGAFSAQVDPKVLEEAEATFALTDDGRLTSSALSTSGQAATLVTSVASLGGAVLGAAVAVTSRLPLMLAAGLTLSSGARCSPTSSGSPRSTLPVAYGETFPAQAQLLERYRQAQATLRAVLPSLGEAVADVPDDGARVAALHHAEGALLALAQQANPLEAHFLAWADAQTVSLSVDVDLLLDVEELPAPAEVADCSTPTPGWGGGGGWTSPA